MATHKCKDIWLQTALKNFWSSANPKLKISSLLKLFHLQDHTKQTTKIRGFGELRLPSSELKYFSIVSFLIKAAIMDLLINLKY